MSSESRKVTYCAARGPDTDVPSRRNTFMFAAQQADTRIASRYGRNDDHRIIGRPVIDDNDFRIDTRLGLERSKGFRNEARPVVDRHHDADARVAHAGNSPMKRPTLLAISLLSSDSSILNTGSCRVSHAENMKPEARAPGICAHIDGANC